MVTARSVKEVGRQVPDENGGYDGLEQRQDAVVGDRDRIGHWWRTGGSAQCRKTVAPVAAGT